MKIIETETDADVCAELIETGLRNALAEGGRATLFLSGGNTPKPVLAKLAQVDLSWDRVDVGLVDDRVEASGSNAAMIRDHLIVGKASGARLHPLIEGDYAELLPADVCVMGMGTDGHTASWFPATHDLARAMDPHTETLMVDVDTADSPGASGFRHRVTLTLPAIMASRQIILHIPGQAKRERFLDREGLPVDALTHSDRLTVIMSPAP